MDSEVVNKETGQRTCRNLDPGECRRKYHYLRQLGVDSYQADKMKTWPWPWIQEWIRRHGNLGDPKVRQYGFQKRRPKSDRTEASTPGNSERKPGGLAEGSIYQEGLYQGGSTETGKQELSLLCGLEAHEDQ